MVTSPGYPTFPILVFLMIKNIKKLSWSETLALVATIVAVGSFIVSIRSCQRSDLLFKLTENEYQEERGLFWIGQINDSLELYLIPTNDLVKIETAIITFPEYFIESPLDLYPPRFSIKLDAVQEKIKEFVFDSFTSQSDREFIAEWFPAFIPMCIEARYYVKGKLLIDRAIYFLNFQSAVSLGDVHLGAWKDSRIIIKSLNYSNKIDNEENTEDVIERLWMDIYGKK
jgi:hypothetical protein